MLINLYAEMKKNQVTQVQIAQTLGLSKQTVCAKMTGKQAFTIDEVIKIRDNYFPDQSIDYLIKRAN